MKWAGPLRALIIPASTKYKVRVGIMKKSEIPEFVWSKECQEGFDKTQRSINNCSYLGHIQITQNPSYWRQMPP